LINASNRSFRIKEPLEHAGYTVVTIPQQKNRILRFIKMVQITLKEHPDLFLIDSSGMIFISAYVISRFFKIPFAARMRGNIWDVFEEMKTYLGFMRLMYLYILLKIVEAILRRSQRVFPVSSGLADALERKGFHKERIRILHYPVDCEKFRPSKKKKDRTTLISITNFSFKAKFEALISVMPQIDDILAEYKDMRYIIVGSGKFSHTIQETLGKMKNADRIFYVGYQKKIEKLLAESDIFLHVSLLDGFPAAVVEAMACELPVVANRYEAMMEQIEHKVTGLFIDDSFLLKDALELLMTDEETKKKMGQNGRLHIIEKFNIDAIAGEYKKEMEDLAKDLRQR
jgi:glycosyltransferase involved in cell wall biosynthesis